MFPRKGENKLLILHEHKGSVRRERMGVEMFTQSTVTTVGPWRWAFFVLQIQPPSYYRISVSGDPFTIGRHLMRKVGMAVKSVLSAVSYSLWRR